MAQDEAAAATTPLEVATHFPGSSGIRLPTDQTIGIDASKLFDVIARMGGAIAKLQDDLKTPPPWVADVREKLAWYEQEINRHSSKLAPTTAPPATGKAELR